MSNKKNLIIGIIILLVILSSLYLIFVPSESNGIFSVDLDVDKSDSNTASVDVNSITTSNNIINMINVYSETGEDIEPNLIIEVYEGNNVERRIFENVSSGQTLNINFERNDMMKIYLHRQNIKRELKTIENIEGRYYSYDVSV